MITDTSGAVIPGATITVLNTNTGVSKDYSSDQAGLNDTSSIVTGSYTITVSKEGFGKSIRGPITLQVGTTTVNVQLSIGDITQQVVVNTDDIPLLKYRV